MCKILSSILTRIKPRTYSQVQSKVTPTFNLDSVKGQVDVKRCPTRVTEYGH